MGDLRQFYRAFFEEASESLSTMERLLLSLDLEAADDEVLNAIFRCAHSIKGSAATFGFADLAALTHQMETLLGKLRRRELQFTPAMLDVLLASGDALRAQLARHLGGGGAEIDTSGLQRQIGAMVEAGSAPAAPAAVLQAAHRAPKADAGRPESTTLRVSVDKIDQLMNLVSELVVTQAMLAQNSTRIDGELYRQFASGLADLERHTRNLQEAVTSIRMIPMSTVFTRFPRMVRDLAAKLGKRVELVAHGEATELDKGLVEKIVDPLTHLVRNSCDHGIEPPHERLAKGKPETGTISLIASHQGGSVVIEVRDDGRGLNRDRLLRKARERGFDAPESMTDAEVWSLIFAPGFSTVEAVTDVSGRGVGMDVVRQNIASLGGSIEVDSADGRGMSVRLRLPLTLAIMEGLSVGVGDGDGCYIVPLSSMVECLQVEPGMIHTIGGNGRIVEVRGESMPLLDLEAMFGLPRSGLEHGSDVMVVVEADGVRIALLVDELLDQQQVIVKQLDANERRVDDVSGTTVMGDGRVALILDVDSLVRRSRH